MNRPGHRGRRWARRLAFLGAALLLAGAGLWGLMQTQSVRTRLLRQLSSQLSRDGRRVELSGLSGPLPGRWTLARVTLGDEQGDWLEIERLSVRMSPAALLRGFVRIEELTADSVHLLRRPVTRRPQEVSPSGGRLPGWFHGLELDWLFVQELKLDAGVAGVPSTWRALGQGVYVLSRRLEVLAHVVRTDGPPGQFELQFQRSEGAAPSFDFHVSVNEGVDGLLAGRLPATLRGPISLWGTGSGAVPDWHADWVLRIGSRVRCEGRAQGFMGTNALGGQIESTAQPWVEGKVSGHFELGGSLAAPKADFNVQLKPVRRAAAPRAPSLEVRLEGGLRPQRLQASLQIDGLADRPIQADASIPLQVSLAPWSLRLLPEEWVGGRLEAEVNLADLARFWAPVDQLVEGTLSLRATCAGILARPEVRGRLHIDHGRYENLKYGLILQQVVLLVEGDRSELVLREARATDGGDGSLALTGRIRLAPAEAFPFQLEGSLQQATLVRHPLLQASFDGGLGLAGNLREMRVEGSLTVPRAEVRIPRTLPSAVEFPDVVEIHTAPSREPPPSPRSPFDGAGRVVLNLKLSAADRLFVRGRGLESEWRGTVTLGGSLSQPALVGSLSVVRGRFLFLGRRFVLGNSVITLGGASPPDPLLSLSAEARAAGLTATLLVTGPLSAPAFSLQSVPPLPEEEILSRILFGSSSDRISPWQALRLAQGVRLLQGGSDTLDILGRGQQWLGVDVLDVRTEGSSGASPVVTVGKYVGDRVYVEGGAGVGAGEVRMSIDLTPSLTLETETSPRIRDEIGLKWHLDY